MTKPFPHSRSRGGAGRRLARAALVGAVALAATAPAPATAEAVHDRVWRSLKRGAGAVGGAAGSAARGVRSGFEAVQEALTPEDPPRRPSTPAPARAERTDTAPAVPAAEPPQAAAIAPEAVPDAAGATAAQAPGRDPGSAAAGSTPKERAAAPAPPPATRAAAGVPAAPHPEAPRPARRRALATPLALAALAALLVGVLLALRWRWRGELVVVIDTPGDRPGEFHVRVSREMPPEPTPRAPGERPTRRSGLAVARRSRSERHWVTREARFPHLGAGSWWIAIEGEVAGAPGKPATWCGTRRVARVEPGHTVRVDVAFPQLEAPASGGESTMRWTDPTAADESQRATRVRDGGFDAPTSSLDVDAHRRAREAIARADTLPLPLPFSGAGRYEIQSEIGRGAMGVVYRARDKRLDRIVALKRLSDQVREHPRAVELMVREAQSAARLNHPNIVTVYDVDQDDDGTTFITMELLEGQPLSAMLRRRGRLAPRQVAWIGRQVAAGLAYAHARGIVHRDIKTANVFATRDRTIKITDFGLAKAVEAVRRRASLIAGTPDYMAPEQAEGLEVDGRADLYALGVTLFELLTGTVPFATGDPRHHHRHTPPPDPRAIVPDLPEPLVALVLALLAKDPADRPASTEAVAAQLHAIEQALAAGRGGA